MKPTIKLRRAIVREARPFSVLALIVVAYLVLETGLAYVSVHHGLVTPSASPSVGFALFAVAVLVARCAVIFVVPFVTVYRLAARLLAWIDPSVP